jgi:hypothetical protein
VKANRVPGHTLRSADVDVQAQGSGQATGKPRLGRAECTCGALSPLLSRTNRLEWHRLHKNEISARSEGNAQ